MMNRDLRAARLSGTVVPGGDSIPAVAKQQASRIRLIIVRSPGFLPRYYGPLGLPPRLPIFSAIRLYAHGLYPTRLQVGSLLFRVALCQRATARYPGEVQHPFRSTMLSLAFAVTLAARPSEGFLHRAEDRHAIRSVKPLRLSSRTGRGGSSRVPVCRSGPSQLFIARPVVWHFGNIASPAMMIPLPIRPAFAARSCATSEMFIKRFVRSCFSTPTSYFKHAVRRGTRSR
jgi:hypothetical protein